VQRFDIFQSGTYAQSWHPGNYIRPKHIYEAESDEYGAAYSAFIIDSQGLDPKSKALFCAGSAMEFSECDVVWIKNYESGVIVFEALE
jgi:hypothetical protein